VTDPQRISALSQITEAAATDRIPIVDVPDVPGGTKRIDASNLNPNLEITAAEIAAGVTPTNLLFPPLNVLRYGAKGDGVTDDFTAIDNARKVSDKAYFGGEDYVVIFPTAAGNTGRYMTSKGFVLDRNGSRWRGEMSTRRVQPTAIAFLASATDTVLMDVTSEAPAFDNLSFEGFSSSGQATVLMELHPKTRLARPSEQSTRGLDGVTLFNFEDVDAEFNNCNFQFSTAAIHTFGRGLYVDTCEFFNVTVGVDLDRETVFQRGEFSGQEEDTGLRGYAIRNTRFHGMGIDSACIRNVGTQKANMGGITFKANLIDTFAAVMYGPIKNSEFNCVHTGIRRKVFDAITTTGLGNASGIYENIDILGTYNCRTFQNQPSGVDSTLDENEITSATVINIASTTGFIVGRFVFIKLDDGTYHKSDIASIVAGVSVTINTGIPSAAASGNAIDMVTELTADNLVYAAGGINISIDVSCRDVFQEVIRFDGDVDTLSVDGSFNDVMSRSADIAGMSLVKLNGGDFTSIKVAGAVKTGSFANNDALVQLVGTHTLTGYNFEGLAFDRSEWVRFSSTNAINPTDPKTETVTATNVIDEKESPRTYYLNAVGGFTSTLPAPVDGLEFEFIVTTAPTTAYIITTNAGANILQGTFLDIVGELSAIINQDTLNFVASTSLVGDSLKVKSDGTNWYCTALSLADGGITVAVT